MKILVLLTVLLLGATPIVADVYRGPSGSVPPGLREPSDPAPPPPPPPTAPTLPMTPRPPLTPPRPQGPFLVTSFEDWMFGWHHQQDAYLGPIGTVEDPRLRETAIAVLREAAVPRIDVPGSLTAAALRALGRATSRSADVGLLLAALDATAGGPYPREGAVLGLGLLRRSHGPRLDDESIAHARQALLGVLEDDRQTPRLRGLAGAALGLLGAGQDPDPAATVARLLAVLRVPQPNVDVAIGAILGIRGFPREAVGQAGLDLLRTLAWEGQLADSQVSQPLRFWAIQAMGRLGSAEDVRPLAGILARTRGSPANERRTAALALGNLGRRLDGNERADAARLLVRVVHEEKDDSTRAFALDSLRWLLAGEGADAVLRDTLAGEVLLTEAAFGKGPLRAWAALELGLLARDASDGSPAGAALRHKAALVLDEGLLDAEPARTRAAFALARGLAADEGSEGALRAIAADASLDRSLRGYASLGLGLLGDAASAPLTRDTLGANLLQQQSEELTLLTAQAGGPVDALAAELGKARWMWVKTAAARSLARSGTEEALQALLAAAREGDAPTRMCALGGLGLALDVEGRPWQVELLGRVNYRASTDLLDQLLSLP